MQAPVNSQNDMQPSQTFLLVVPPYNLTNQIDYGYTWPIGLSYVSAALKQAGVHVDCLNLNHERGRIGDLVKAALDAKTYDWAGTGNNALRYGATQRIIDSVRRHVSRLRIVLGGPIVTTEPELIFAALSPDFAILGEGEETIVELLECVAKHDDLEQVQGIMYWNGNGSAVSTGMRPPIRDIDRIPVPDFEGLGFREWSQ